MESGFLISCAELRIPKPRISGSKIKIFLNLVIQITLHGVSSDKPFNNDLLAQILFF